MDTRKAIALLAYLALAGRPISRTALAVLLWPDYDATRAFEIEQKYLRVREAAAEGKAPTDCCKFLPGKKGMDECPAATACRRGL